jgi:hypothetical protein
MATVDTAPSGPPQKDIPTSATPSNETQAKVSQRPFYTWFARVDWKVVAELFLGLVIAFATVVNVGVAIRQWSAMTDNNSIAQKALTAVQRAFITVSELKQEPVLDKDGTTISWRFTPVIKNSGPTDAEAVTLVAVTPHQAFTVRPPQFTINGYDYLSWKVGAPRDPDELINSPVKAPVYLSNFTIGPQGASVTASQLTDELTLQDIQNSFSNRIGRFFFGTVHYTDVFGTEHISKFCFRTDGIYIRRPGEAFPIQSLCSHWNCTDKSCPKDRDSYNADMKQAIAEGMPVPPVPKSPIPGPPPQAVPAQPKP